MIVKTGARRHAPLTLPLLIAGLAALSCGGKAPVDAGAPPAEVSAAVRTAALTEVPEFVEVTGSVEPVARVSPGTKIMGRIETVAVREGDRVARGRLLAKLESRDLEATVEQARAGIAVARAQLENAKATFERMKALHARGSVTDKNLEDATAGYEVAQGMLRQAEANENAALVMLSYAEIRSDLAGYVTAKRVEAGDLANPGMPLFTIEDLSHVKVTLRVAERDVVGLREGSPATATIDVLQNEVPATIDRIVPAGDPRSRTFDVRLVLDNPDGAIKSGMFARARFPKGSRPAILVPASAVVERGQLHGIYAVDDDGRAWLRWVRLGPSAGDQIEILSGLDAGQALVVDPGASFPDGAKVTGVR
jgi:RND family efflux transporter MFP subunit